MWDEQLWAQGLTLAIVLVYFIKQWCWPAPITRHHERLRTDWLLSVSATPGTEVLAVQTIRNSLMSCTMTATAATLAFMGGVSLLSSNWVPAVTAENQMHTLRQMPSMFAVLVLLGLSFITSMLSARQWHHAGFVAGMPVGSTQRQQWLTVGQKCLSKAGHYYALSVRLLIWCIPLMISSIFGWVGTVISIFLLAILARGMDR